MVTAARALSPAVLEKLSVQNFPTSDINENTYFLGHGAENNLRLSAAGNLPRRAAGKLSLAHFMSDYCVPIRHAEHWLAAKRKEYGALLPLPSAGMRPSPRWTR